MRPACACSIWLDRDLLLHHDLSMVYARSAQQRRCNRSLSLNPADGGGWGRP